MDIMINIMQVSVSVVMALPDWHLIPLGELLGCFRFMETLSGKFHETVGECGVGYEIKSIVWCER